MAKKKPWGNARGAIPPKRESQHNFPCRACDKISYQSRQGAKQSLKDMREKGYDVEGMHIYACPHGNGIHLGHAQTRSFGRPNLNDPRLNHVEEP